MPKLYTCECSDPGCPVHPGASTCPKKGAHLLLRADMEDDTGTCMCSGCADDALNAGVFTEPHAARAASILKHTRG